MKLLGEGTYGRSEKGGPVWTPLRGNLGKGELGDAYSQVTPVSHVTELPFGEELPAGLPQETDDATNIRAANRIAAISLFIHSLLFPLG